MKILIVGGGKLVYFLSRTFLSKGYAVAIVNRNMEECVRLSRRLNATIIHGDGSDPRILEEARADQADAVLAATPDDADNLVICQLASLRFHVPRTLTLVNDPEHEEVFQKLGITTALSATRILSSLIEQQTSFEEITNLLPLSEGKVNMTEILLQETSPVVGKSLREVALPENALIAYLMRSDQPVVPRGSTVLQSNDKLILISLPDNYSQVLKTITGKSS